MTFSTFDAWWWPFIFILLAGWLPTGMWRYMGVYLSADIDETAKILVFVRSVATALVAAVIAKLILYPDGALAATSSVLRVCAAIIGFLCYYFAGKRVWLGILVAELILMAGFYWSSLS